MTLTSDLLDALPDCCFAAWEGRAERHVTRGPSEASPQNSALPETQALAEKHASVVGTAPTFYGLEVIEEMPVS
jgi:hypothetical protein